jgi:hypothetical protein
MTAFTYKRNHPISLMHFGFNSPTPHPRGSLIAARNAKSYLQPDLMRNDVGALSSVLSNARRNITASSGADLNETTRHN